MAREIVLDTETTGLDPQQGHRLIEIACVELEDYVPTGAHFHCYINPERDIDADAERVHGISRAFLDDKPTFDHPEVVDALLELGSPKRGSRARPIPSTPCAGGSRFRGPHATNTGR